MNTSTQKAKAIQFRQMHTGTQPLVLPNAWDAASASVFFKAGFQAIATTSSGVAAAFGYSDGQHIHPDIMIEVIAHIARTVDCPVTADIEAGFGSSIAEVLQTIRAVITAGAVGINIEDSTKQQESTLVDIAYQVELLKAIQALGASMDVPIVINARTDIFLLRVGDASSQMQQAVQRLNAYREAGADSLFPIGVSDANTIARLVQAVHGPINILASSSTPSIPALAQLGVARVSFGSGPMRAALGRLQRIAQELLSQGTYTAMSEEALSGAAFRSLFPE